FTGEAGFTGDAERNTGATPVRGDGAETGGGAGITGGAERNTGAADPHRFLPPGEGGEGEGPASADRARPECGGGCPLPALPRRRGRKHLGNRRGGRIYRGHRAIYRREACSSSPCRGFLETGGLAGFTGGLGRFTGAPPGVPATGYTTPNSASSFSWSRAAN